MISDALAKAGGANVDVDEARRSYARLYDKHCLDHSRPYPGVVETLSNVTDQRLAVLSNKPEAACRTILHGLGLSRFFSFVAGGDTFARMKPAPDGLYALAELYGITIRHVLMVGDSVYDIEAAQAAGARSCAVTWGFQPAEELKALDPDFTVSAFSELLPLLRTIKSGTINQTDN
jgi:phosphoglycolate phosphatase